MAKTLLEIYKKITEESDEAINSVNSKPMVHGDTKTSMKDLMIRAGEVRKKKQDRAAKYRAEMSPEDREYVKSELSDILAQVHKDLSHFETYHPKVGALRNAIARMHKGLDKDLHSNEEDETKGQ